MDFSEAPGQRHSREHPRLHEQGGVPLEPQLARQGFAGMLPCCRPPVARPSRPACGPPRSGGARGGGLSLTEFAHLSEELGKSRSVTTCSTSSTRRRNMEILMEFGHRAEGEVPGAAGARRYPQLLHHDRAEFAGSIPCGSAPRRAGRRRVGASGHKWFATGAQAPHSPFACCDQRRRAEATSARA